MRIAIVGSGIAGLAAARALAPRHTVEIFEAAERPGGHTHTVHTSLGGRRIPVDTGFIIYNERTYPLFTRLLGELGVTTRPTEMSFGSSCQGCGLEYGSAGLSSLFAQRANLVRPRHYRLLTEILRFFRVATSDLEGRAPVLAQSLGEYLADRAISADAVSHFIVPMGAAIWSTSPSHMLAFPAATFVRFFANHGMLGLTTAPRWRTVVGGSERYVTALLAALPARLHLGRAVLEVQRDARGVTLLLSRQRNGARDHVVHFDRVILATHADTSLALLAQPTADELRVLSPLRYTRNETYLHTDASFLPRNRRAWSCWNYRVSSCRDALGPPEASYWMNALQGLPGPDQFIVTLNPRRAIDPARILERIDYRHPLFDFTAIAAQRELPRLQGVQGTYFAGAYQGYGFHEDGLRSGLEAAACLERQPASLELAA